MDWIFDVAEPWPTQRRSKRSNRPSKRRSRHLNVRLQKSRSLEDDRAATFCFYSCSICDNDNSCCDCPDPRPEIPVPAMYVIDTKDGSVRRLTYYEAVHALTRKNHDIEMEYYITHNPRHYYEDVTTWRCNPDPLNVRYRRPKFSLTDDDYE